MSGAVLRVRGLHTSFPAGDGQVQVVDGLSLEVAAGEVLALVGESGCGKSITALALMKLLPPGCRQLAGEIEFEGDDLSQLSEGAMRRLRGGGIGMVFQEPMTSLNPVMRVGAQIAEAVRLHDRPEGKIKDRVLLTSAAV